jgi:hypothetical protein
VNQWTLVIFVADGRMTLNGSEPYVLLDIGVLEQPVVVVVDPCVGGSRRRSSMNAVRVAPPTGLSHRPNSSQPLRLKSIALLNGNEKIFN